jgi:curved DNA-binding protein CbpA
VARAGPGGGGPGGDLYALLNVPPTATKKEIKAAYKKAALKFHPDVNKAPDAAERFNEAKQAYQTLADEDSRRRYDALRAGSGVRRVRRVRGVTGILEDHVVAAVLRRRTEFSAVIFES